MIMDVVEQEVNTAVHWTAVAVTHVEYQKGRFQLV